MWRTSCLVATVVLFYASLAAVTLLMAFDSFWGGSRTKSLELLKWPILGLGISIMGALCLFPSVMMAERKSKVLAAARLPLPPAPPPGDEDPQ